MNRHLKDIGSIVPKGRHAPVILDRAGWHRSGDLVFPDKCIGPEAAPHSPELNSAKNVFQFHKSNHFASQVFENAGDVKKRVAAAWKNFTGQAERIKSTGHRSRARVQ